MSATPGDTQEDPRRVGVDTAGVMLEGDLVVPAGARGLVVFAHGSGSSRHSPRNVQVAAGLRDHGLATLLIDLLTATEEDEDRRTAAIRFDIGLLADRLEGTADWLDRDPATADLSLGYFGASTGAGAALVAAAHLGQRVEAVVSRGGRPDLAGDELTGLRAPTLLIVGSRDEPVIALNRQAQAKLTNAPTQLEIVAGATHLFEEPGALEEVTRLAGDWFTRHLAGRTSRRR